MHACPNNLCPSTLLVHARAPNLLMCEHPVSLHEHPIITHMGAVLGIYSRVRVARAASVTCVGEGHDLLHASHRDGSTSL